MFHQKKSSVIPLLLIIVTACGIPFDQPSAVPDLATTAQLTDSPSLVHLPDTITPSYPPQCFFNWAEQPLPDLTEQVNSALKAAGLPIINALVYAYGENCYNSQNNEVVHFAALETDFRLTLQVENLNDMEYLGNLLETILIVLDGFPTESTPGPNPGYIGIVFQSGQEVLNLWFTTTEGKAARAQGLHGKALLITLQAK